MTNILLGKQVLFRTNYSYKLSECISSTVTDILANRFGASPVDNVATDHKYDDDLNIIETIETGPFVTPIHYGPTGMIPAENIEKLIHLICHQWHQGLMQFHQAIQGKKRFYLKKQQQQQSTTTTSYFISAHILVSCPLSVLMPQTMNSPKWSLRELISSFNCYNCLSNSLSKWAPCLRQSAMVNCHPNLTSRCRQIWFIMLNFLKYIKSDPEFDDEDYKFNDENELEHHDFQPTAADKKRFADYMPKGLKWTRIVTRGKIFIRAGGTFAMAFTLFFRQ